MDSPRPLRADAVRNRRRILDAARVVFAREGLGAARVVFAGGGLGGGGGGGAGTAGVGVGPLYRRFPTKDDLLLAVVEDLTETIVADIETASALDDPGEAFAAAAMALAASTA